MIPDILQSAGALADALAAENRALAGLDFSRAVALLDTKQRATEALIAAHAAPAAGEPLGRRRLLADAAARLRELAAENKRLLERAVVVQGRVIGAIVRAVPKAAGGVPRYGAGGALAQTTMVRPMALSSRA